MPAVRQMPKLYLRGSLSTITMASITEQDRHTVDDIVKYVAQHKQMVKHKHEIIKQFGVTIGGDYADDKIAAENEYNIAIWRGVLSLLYHRNYTFQCSSCQQKEYKTKRGKYKAIDQQSISCPNCNMTRLSTKGTIETEDEFINYEHYRKLLTLGHHNCSISTPIIPIPGEKKYQDPKEILDDPKQLKKFFGEFAWNYFRQHLKENKRTEHKKTPRLISGEADFVIAEEIRSLCDQMSVECIVNKDNTGYSAYIPMYQTAPEFSIEYSRINKKARNHGVELRIDGNTVHVEVTDTTLNQQEIEAIVVKTEHVSMSENNSEQNEDGLSAIDQIDYHFVEGRKMILEDHVSMIETSDAIETVRKSLPDGTCKVIYDILCQSGETYDQYSDRFGIGDPKINHMAEYLGITTKAVNEFKNQIKLVCMSHGLTP